MYVGSCKLCYNTDNGMYYIYGYNTMPITKIIAYTVEHRYIPILKLLHS